MRQNYTATSNRKYATPEVACSKDAARPALNEPWLDIMPDGSGILYATDSYVAVKIPVELDSGDTPGVVPAGILKAARTGPMNRDGAAVMLNGDARAIGKEGTVSAPRADDIDPPNLEALWPPDTDPERYLTVKVEAAKILQVAKAIGADLGITLSIPLPVEGRDTYRPMVVRGLHGVRGEGLVMPIR